MLTRSRSLIKCSITLRIISYAYDDLKCFRLLLLLHCFHFRKTLLNAEASLVHTRIIYSYLFSTHRMRHFSGFFLCWSMQCKMNSKIVVFLWRSVAIFTLQQWKYCVCCIDSVYSFFFYFGMTVVVVVVIFISNLASK